MPLRFVIDHAVDLVLTTAEGDVSDEDLVEHATNLAAIADRPMRELVDFSDRVGSPVSLSSVRNMADFLREHDSGSPGGKLALVGRDDEIFGTLRVFEAHRADDSIDLRVFRDRDEALEWLGIKPSDLADSLRT